MPSGGAADWVAPPSAGISLLGFHFSYRGSQFDWRLLHGIDPEAVVKLTDVRAVEDCLATLQSGNLETEQNLSSNNCVQLFRLMQLAIEYVWHLRNAHTILLEQYATAAAAANQWRASASLFLDTGSAFIASCLQTGDMNRAALDTVDEVRRQLEQLDHQYNAALDRLEEEDQHARYFHFRKQRAELNWKHLYSVDLEQLVANTDLPLLDKVLHNITFGSIIGEDREELTPHHFSHLIPLAQVALDYMLFQANATGGALERSMSELQGACVEIPSLTAATQALHLRLTSFLLEAQQQAAQLTSNGMSSPSRGGLGSQGMGNTNNNSPGMGEGLGGLGMGMRNPSVGTGGLGLSGLGMGSQGMAGQNMGAMQMMDASGNPLSRPGSPWQQQMARMGSEVPLEQNAWPAIGLAQQPLAALLAHQQNLGLVMGGLGSGMGSGMGPNMGDMGMLMSGMGPGMGSGMGSMGGMGSGMGVYDETMVLAQAGAMQPAMEMQTRVAELQFKLEALESDMRLERGKNDEAKRLLDNLQDRVTGVTGNHRPIDSGTLSDNQANLQLSRLQGPRLISSRSVMAFDDDVGKVLDVTARQMAGLDPVPRVSRPGIRGANTRTPSIRRRAGSRSNDVGSADLDNEDQGGVQAFWPQRSNLSGAPSRPSSPPSFRPPMADVPTRAKSSSIDNGAQQQSGQQPLGEANPQLKDGLLRGVTSGVVRGGHRRTASTGRAAVRGAGGRGARDSAGLQQWDLPPVPRGPEGQLQLT